jgi:hypothetical protein
METLTTILQWLIPAGGIGSVVAWLFSKTLRNLRTTKEVHDTYKDMYETLDKTVKDLQNEIIHLYKEIERFRRAVARAPTCRYYDNCPVRHELLREQEVDTKPKGRKRQHTSQGNEANRIRADTDLESAIDNPG